MNNEESLLFILCLISAILLFVGMIIQHIIYTKNDARRTTRIILRQLCVDEIALALLKKDHPELKDIQPSDIPKYSGYYYYATTVMELIERKLRECKNST